MPAHTPGPWAIASVFPKKDQGHTFEPRVWITASDGSTLNMVRLADIPDGDDPEQMSNARLIAAAPRMREFLAKLANETCDHGPMPSCPRDEARAILRDVEGETV